MPMLSSPVSMSQKAPFSDSHNRTIVLDHFAPASTLSRTSSRSRRTL